MKNKAIWLLVVIYLAFIALGLPDALLGSAWNLVRDDLHVSLGTLGIMTVTVYFMSVLATYNAPRLLRLLQTKKIVFISILFTGASLVIMSRVSSFYQMLFFALPLGMGAGAIDVSLNHYLASNYKAHHMNFLHSFYGIGVTSGPTIMAYTLRQESWRTGYVVVGIVLLVISLIVLLSFKMWKKEDQEEKEERHAKVPFKAIVKTKGALTSILIFLFYVHFESLNGVWIASYFYIIKGVSYSTAALFTTAYYLALTIGRLSSGFVSYKVHPNTLIKGGVLVILVGTILMFVNVNYLPYYFVVAFLLGLGSAPIFPNMMFVNSLHFDKNKMSKIMSLQMAIGYIGFGALTPLAGLLFDQVSISYFPVILISVSVLIVFLVFRYLSQVKKVNQV